MQESAMYTAKTPNETFLQSIGNEIATQADRSHQSEMEIIKPKILAKGIVTQQRLMGQQQVNQEKNVKYMHYFKMRIFSSNNTRPE
jgi:hypothetical protein